MPNVFHDAFEEDIANNRSMTLEDVWHAHNPELKPHVMMSIGQAAIGTNDTLLRTELISIVAIMLTRLENERFRNYTIIPVRLAHLLSRRPLTNSSLLGYDAVLYGPQPRQNSPGLLYQP